MYVYYNFEHSIEFNSKEKNKPFVLSRTVYIKIEKKGKRVQWLTIPRGFKSDGCSIPKIFRWLLGCQHTPQFVPASIIHDYLIENSDLVSYDRKRASLIFFHSLINEGVSPVKAALMFIGVELWQAVKNLWEDKWI